MTTGWHGGMTDAPDDKPKDVVAAIAAQIAKSTTGDRAALRRLHLTQSHKADGVVIGLLCRAGVTMPLSAETIAPWQPLAHVAALLSNLTGCARSNWAGDHDRDLAARVVKNFVHLVTEISPGAKKGSTAPHSRAEMVLVEVGDRQPRTLANAFRDPVLLTDHASNHELGFRTAAALLGHLSAMDDVYATGEARRHMALPDLRLTGADHANLAGLVAWAGSVVRSASTGADQGQLA